VNKESYMSSGKLTITSILTVAVLAVSLLMPTSSRQDTAHAAVSDQSSWHLVFDDEFSGSQLDPTKWTAVNQGPSSGTGEQEFYQPDHVSVANGNLVIKTDAQSSGGEPYTSGRVESDGLFTFTYGRVDFRAKSPAGHGMWPAVWLLGNSCGRITGSCSSHPNAGAQEIDMMEQIGVHPSTNYMTLHAGPNDTGTQQCIWSGPDLTSDYHDYSLIWSPGEITWYVDGTNRCDKTVANSFDTPMYLIINNAVGSTSNAWDNNYPDSTTQFPQYTYIKYVRVYQGTSVAPGSVLAINAGSAENVGGFAPDIDYSGGITTTILHGVDTNTATDPADPGVYESARTGSSFSYSLPRLTPNAAYRLRLHFAETVDTGPGQRMFNVAVTDGAGTRTVLQNLDVYAAAGGASRALQPIRKVGGHDGVCDK